MTDATVTDATKARTLLDPVEVLKALTGSPAYVIVTFGAGATAKGSVVASDDHVSALLDHDATASFVRHDAVLAVTVRDAHAFEGDLGLPGAEVVARPLGSVAGVGAATSPDPAFADMPIHQLQSLLSAAGFAYDETAVLGADASGRVGLATLAAAVDEALRSIAGDQAANDAMVKDVSSVRLSDGVSSSAVIEGTTLVVTSPWTRGPAAVYDPASLRAAIIDAAR